MIYIFSVPTTVYQKPLGQIFLKDSANKTFVIQRQKQVPNDSKQVQMQGGPSTVHSSNQGPETVRTLSTGQGPGSSGPHGGQHGPSGNSGQPTVTAYESSYQKQPTRLTSNGTNYEIKGIPNSQSTYSNDQRPHVLSVFPRKSIIQVSLRFSCHIPTLTVADHRVNLLPNSRIYNFFSRIKEVIKVQILKSNMVINNKVTINK